MSDRIEIEVREDGSRVAKQNLEQLASQAEVTAASIDLMRSAMATIRGSVQGPVASLEQMKSALLGIQAAARSPGGMLDWNNLGMAATALDRLKSSAVDFGKVAPASAGAAMERLNLGAGALSDQINKVTAAQKALQAAQQSAKAPVEPYQGRFDFLIGPSPAVKEATAAVAQVDKSVKQLSFDMEATTQGQLKFMAGMKEQLPVANELAKQYSTVGTVWSKTTKEAQQLTLGIQELSREEKKAISASIASQRAAMMPGPRQSEFGFMDEPMKLSGPGWQLQGTFKQVAAGAQQAAGTIASLAAPTQTFAAAATQASHSTQQMNLNLGAANQTSFAFMGTLKPQAQTLNTVSVATQQAGTHFTGVRQQAQQLTLGMYALRQAAGAAGGGLGGAGAAAGAAGGGFNQGSASVAHFVRNLWYLRVALEMVAGFLFLRQIREFIDGWIATSNSIRLATSSAEEAATVQSKLFEVAQKTRSSYEDQVVLYRRAQMAQTNLAATQQQLVDFTEAVGLAMGIQGTKTEQARGSLLQLGQMLGMARVRMQEFTSISENTPRLLKAIAEHMDGMSGSIGRLREKIQDANRQGSKFDLKKWLLMGDNANATIEAKDLFQALLKALPQLREEFARVQPTIGQAFTVFSNAAMKYIGETDQAEGYSRKFASAVIYLADHLQTLGRVLAIISLTGLTLAIPKLTSMLVGTAATATQAASGLHALWAAMAAHPVLLLIAAIVAAGSALYFFRDSIIICERTGSTLGDGFRVQFQYIAEAAHWLRGVITDIFRGPSGIASVIVGAYADVKKDEATNIFQTLADGVKEHINFMLAQWVALARVVPDLWSGMWASVSDIGVTAINDQIEHLQNFVNLVVMAWNIFDKLKNPFAHIELPQIELPRLTNENEGAAKALGEKLAGDIFGSFSTDFVGKAIADFQHRLDAVTKDRLSKQAVPSVNLNLPPPPGPPKGNNESEITALTKALASLHATVDPVWGGFEKIREAEKMVNEAIRLGIPLWDTKKNILAQVAKHYEDATHPYEAYVRKIREEIEIDKQFGPERKGALEALKAELDLKKKLGGKELTDSQKEEIKNLNIQKQYLRELAQAKEHVYNQTVGVIRAWSVSQEALNRALEQGWITTQQWRHEMAQLAINAGHGSWVDGFIHQLGVLEKKTTAWGQRTGQIFADVVNGLVDGVANSIGKAVAMGDNLLDTLRQVGQEVLSNLIAAFVKLGMQMLLNKLLGDSLAAASVATTVTAAGVVGAAWAAPAALASLATLGSNAAGADTALVSSVALAKGLAIGGVASLKSGGYTGDAGRDEVAGVFHGQEFVVNADATKRYRGLLETINAGGRPQSHSYAVPIAAGSAQHAPITIHNYAPGVTVEPRVTRGEVQLWIREGVEQHAPGAVARDMYNPNSRTATAVRQTTTARARR